jgi:hypothetical protein
MTDISETSRSHIVHLLEEQKYDEVLPILSDLREKNPSDRESRVYHLLVVRILVLRWNLSRTVTRPAIDSSTMTKRTIKRLASVVRVSESTKFIQSLGQIYQAAETALAKRRIKRVIIAGAGSGFLITLLASYMVEGSNVAIQVPSNILTSTDLSHPTVSALGVKAYNPNNSRTADEDGRQIPLPTEADERNFFRASEPRELLPTEHLQDSKEQKLTRSGPDVAKATSQVNASKLFAERQQPKAVLNIESSRELAANENNGDKTPREILGHYQSQRAVPIRKSTSFAAPIVREIDSGISLNVLEFVGSWAKVELEPAGITGFVRREFLITVKKNESNVADNSPSGEEISDITVFPLGSAS